MVTSQGPRSAVKALHLYVLSGVMSPRANKAARVHMDAGVRHIHIQSLGARRRMEAGGALPVNHMTALLRATQEMGGQCFVCV